MLERDAIGRARGAMSAVDAHLRGSIVALETLAAADSLAAGDLRKFHADSQFALRTQTAWSNIAVTGADGTQLATAGDDGAVILWDVSDRAAPARRATLLGLAEGWAALAPDGRYKWEGDATAEFWYAVGMCRFEPGELDDYLSDVRQLPMDAVF